MAETKEVISARKERQETEKPSARADWAETDAADAIDHAEARIDETEGAMLYAAVARLDSHAGE